MRKCNKMKGKRTGSKENEKMKGRRKER